MLLAFLCINLLVFTATAFANDYYVSPAGSDSNDGSQARPWKTISHADASLTVGASTTCSAAGGWFSRPGYGACVHVAPGTYNIGGELITNKSGVSANQRVGFVSDTKWGALVRQSSGGSSVIFLARGQWSDIIGFDISTTQTSVNTGNYGLDANADHIRLIGNRVHDVALGSCADDGGAGITNSSSATTDVQALGNLVFNVGGPNAGGRCRYFHGIYLNNPNDVIQNNISYGNAAFGITCRHNCSGAVISNNTVFNNGGYGHGNQPASGSPLTCCFSGTNSGVGGGILVGNDSGSQSNTTISNNIVYNNGAADGAASGFACGIWDFHSNLINSVVVNNLVRNDGTGNGAGTPCSPGLGTAMGISVGTSSSVSISGTITSNPQFVDYQANGSGDYHLLAQSPAIGAGATTCAPGGASPCTPTTDFDSTLRSASLSLGVFEVAQSTILPSPPIGLTAVVQ